MADPVSLAEAKLFLRVSYDTEDTLITTLLAAAKTRLEGVSGLTLDHTAPAPMRLCLLYLLAQAYANRGEIDADPAALEAWLAPYREVRL